MKQVIRLLIALAFAHASLGQHAPKVELAHEKFSHFLNLRDFCISKNNDEIYFTAQSPSQEISQILYMKKVKGKWSEPELMPFSNVYSDLEPFLSYDQNTLYFASNRPTTAASESKKDFDIWFVNRQNKNVDWSKPQNMGAPVNSENNEFYPSLSKNNNLYFTSDATTATTKDDIYFCTYENGRYQSPKPLGATINSTGYEFNAFISPNEDFLLFTKYNSEDGLGSGDLYISYSDKQGNWGAAKNLGIPVNTKFMEYCPFYDETNETLYFTSRRDNLVAKKFNNVTDFNHYISGSENGLSKIYAIRLKLPTP